VARVVEHLQLVGVEAVPSVGGDVQRRDGERDCAQREKVSS